MRKDLIYLLQPKRRKESELLGFIGIMSVSAVTVGVIYLLIYLNFIS